jgi:hypothetical protein
MAIAKDKMVKIRLKGLNRGPIEITVLPRKKLIFDESGIAEVEERVANILLGPAHAGEGYELVTEKTEKEITPSVIRKSKEEALSDVGEFVKQI